MDQRTGMPGPARPLDLEADPARRDDRPHYGVVDIGSNSVRLVIYDQLGRAPLPRFNEKSLCRLGDGLAQTGAIDPDNFKRTVEAARRFSAIAEAMGVTRLDVTATEAIRKASNGADLVAAIASEAGLKVRVLSGAEEAHYATMGVISGFFRPVGLVGDMGGGSLEVCEALDDHPGERWVSLPLGALPVEALMSQGIAEARKAIDESLKDGLPPGLSRPVFYAVGGGWRTFAKAHMASVGAPVPVVHGYQIDTASARAFAKSLYKSSVESIAALPGVATRRARTMPAAALVLERLLKRLAPDHVTFSALGLREGWLYAQLPEEERYFDPLVEGASLIGLPQARVPRFAPVLVDWTSPLFPGESTAEKRLRVAACALSDLAWRDPPEMRAEESFRRVLLSPLIGLDHAERVFLALATHSRYAGSPDAAYLSPAVEILPKSGRRRAQMLGRALRLAYRLSGGVPAVLTDSALAMTNDCLRLTVGAAASVPDSEVVADRLKLLASAMGAKRTEVVVREG